MEHIQVEEEFDIWEKNQNTIALEQQKAQFNNDPPNSQYAQDWANAIAYNGYIVYRLDGNNIIAKHNLTQEEVDVTNLEDLEVNFDFVQKKYSQAEKWFNEQNLKIIEEQSGALMKQLQNGVMHKTVYATSLNQIKADLASSKLIWTVTPTGIIDIYKAVHSYTGKELDFTDYDE